MESVRVIANSRTHSERGYHSGQEVVGLSGGFSRSLFMGKERVETRALLPAWRVERREEGRLLGWQRDPLPKCPEPLAWNCSRVWSGRGGATPGSRCRRCSHIATYGALGTRPWPALLPAPCLGAKAAVAP